MDNNRVPVLGHNYQTSGRRDRKLPADSKATGAVRPEQQPSRTDMTLKCVSTHTKFMNLFPHSQVYITLLQD